MDRRDALKWLAGGAFGGLGLAASAREVPPIAYFGAEPPDGYTRQVIDTRPRPRFYDRYPIFRGVSMQTENVLLYKHLEKELGKIVPHYQGPAPDGAPGEGDCCAQAAGLGVDVLAAVNKHLLGLNEKFIAKSSVEMLFAASRNEIGKGQLKGGSGSRGIWMAQAAQQIGVLHRIPYKIDGHELDLTGYHPGRSRKYRDTGVPDWLEPIAREHPVKEYTTVTSGREALDAVAAGQVVILCSSYAFPNKRDAQGFSAPLLGMTRGRRGWRMARPQWWHAMILVAKVNIDGREGGTVCNSAGIWNEGPQPNDMPDGSFNVETQYLDLMVKDWGDCHALSGYTGHQAARIKHRLY